MDRKSIISMLRTAKSSHIKWRAYAQALASGLEVDEDKVPVLYTECDFGKWYYGSGQVLSSLPSYRALENPHEMMHKLYLKLFQHLFHEENQSLFSRLLGKKSDRRENAVIIDKLVKEIVEMSRLLLDAIDLLEQDVNRMPDKELELMV